MACNPFYQPASFNGGDLGSGGDDFEDSDGESSDDATFDDISIEEPQEEVFEGLSAPRPTSIGTSVPPTAPVDSDDFSMGSLRDLQIPSASSATARSTTNGKDPTIPKGKSIAHNIIEGGKAVFISFDIETGGEFCGILQVSAEIFRQNPVDFMGTDFIRDPDTFNEYVQPPKDALWNEQVCRNSHGLSANSDVIKSAHRFDIVWSNFCSWISRHIRNDETCILVAYNGATCDLRWIWKHLQAPRTTLSMPPCIKFFLDPLKTIQSYKSCPLHPSKSKLESLELGCVWKHIKGSNLNGAYDSLVDVKAQTDVVIHSSFHKFIDRAQSIRLVADIFSKNEQSKMAKRLEPSRPVHEPWLELEDDTIFEWSPDARDTYDGFDGGGIHGPSQVMLGVSSVVVD